MLKNHYFTLQCLWPGLCYNIKISSVKRRDFVSNLEAQ